MKYIEYCITGIPDEEASEIVVAELADMGFDSFSEYLPERKTLRPPRRRHSRPRRDA